MFAIIWHGTPLLGVSLLAGISIFDADLTNRPEFPLWAFCPADNIHLTIAELNCQSDLQC
jgi:hypothetical protein